MPQTTRGQLQEWLDAPEGSRLEFKEAKQNYHFEKLVEYCVALANEGGGHMVLGVTDTRPRRIVGTQAFAEPGRTEAGLHERLSHRIPAGITPENVLDQQNPRNRRLSEALGKCGLIERAGQGMNLMFESAIRQGKALPSFAGTSGHEVRLTLEGSVQNPVFVRFLERLGDETLRSFGTYDFLALDYLYRELPLPPLLKARIPRLIDVGAVETIGRGKGARHLLSQRLYAALGARGVHTRKRGLDHETNKALLEKHLRGRADEGAPLPELRQVLPAESESAVQRLLAELREEGRVQLRGSRRWARWVVVKPNQLTDV